MKVILINDFRRCRAKTEHNYPFHTRFTGTEPTGHLSPNVEELRLMTHTLFAEVTIPTSPSPYC